MSAEPDPLRCGVSALSATLSMVGIARPRPRPVAANQPDTKPVPLAALVAVPMARATAMMANPVAPMIRALTGGGPAGPPIMGSIRIPLPSESKPLTSRKNCGIAKVRPNSANETIVLSTVPQVNPREANNSRSTSGSVFVRLTARSQPTNAASTTTPARMVATAAGSDQPASLALMKPYVSDTSPALEISTPSASTLNLLCPRDSGIRKITAASAITTIGTLMRKTEPHQNLSSSQPPRMGPRG